MSKYNFNINSLGFKDDTEKAIFFLNMIDALVGARFKVLQMKNNKKILEFCGKLPTFNGKEYFYFKNFDHADFDWIVYDETVAYNEWHIGSFYSTLIAQFSASAELKDARNLLQFYFTRAKIF